jgi:hypothetical protein
MSAVNRTVFIVIDGKSHNQIDHILIDKRKHSSMLDIRSSKAEDCHTDHYLVVAKLRDELAVSKQKSHRFSTEMFSLKKTNAVEGEEKYRVEVSNRFAALEDLLTAVEINGD